MRILGLDFGDRTVGVSVSDPFGWTAQGLEVIRRKDEPALKETIKRLSEIIKEYEVTLIVLGYPKNMNNSEGARCEKTLVFKAKLERAFKVPIVLWDERLSTVAANRSLMEADLSRAKRATVIDKQAAIFILQGYLDSIANKNNNEEEVK